MIPANLTVNADDFGLNEKASAWIFRCIQEGLVNSISVLPFRNPEQERILRTIISEYPDVKVGVHLSLIETPALTDYGAETGQAAPPADYRQFLKKYFRGGIDPNAVYAEWQAQIRLVGDYLGSTSRIAHLDSHQHVHVLPGLWEIASQLQKEHGIGRLRVPYESVRRGLFHQFPFGFALQVLARLRMRKETPRFIGIFTSMRFTVNGNLQALAQVGRRPDLSFELMVHPGQSPQSGNPRVAGLPGGKGAAGAVPMDPEIEELRQLNFFFHAV